MQKRQLIFATFRLDPVSQELWRDEQLVPIRPKLFVVLSVCWNTPGGG